METAPVNSNAVPVARVKRATWRNVAEVLSLTVLCAGIAMVSCACGAYLCMRAGNAGTWLPILAVLGVNTGPGRMAFAAGITMGFTVRSFYRSLFRLAMVGTLLGAVALVVCLPGIDESNWVFGMLRYGAVGGAAGAVIAMAQIRRRIQACR
jgi:hypothetical protein